jgi:threonine dehydrogenase-like Zn-dependent dehydrogenase
MLALVVTPGESGSARITDLPAPGSSTSGVLLKPLEVGVCGTDKEISHGVFGVAPVGAPDLVLGHELIAEVVRDGYGFTAGDLVTSTVRRSCGRCDACAENSPDACDTGAYKERGITELDGYARELLVEDPAQLIPVPARVGRLGVLAEPGSICARALRHANAIGDRQIWRPKRTLVLGAGAIGMLLTHMLRLDGHEVWTAAREPSSSLNAQLARAAGARYVDVAEETPAALSEEVGGFDLIIEAAGEAQLMLDLLCLLRRNGVGCLLGLDGRQQQISMPGRVLGIDTVIENRVLFGSVNAHPQDWHAAVQSLDRMQERWGDSLAAMVGLRVSPDRFEEAFAYDGVKATLRFD